MAHNVQNNYMQTKTESNRKTEETITGSGDNMQEKVQTKIKPRTFI